MRGGSPPDNLYEDFSKYFEENYDIFKGNDWFLHLSYTLQEMGADPYKESLLIDLTCFLAIVYMQMKENDEDTITDSDEVNEDFIERFAAKTRLYFPKGPDGNIDRRFFVDFLSKLTEYSEKLNTDEPRINLQKGQLDDQSFLGDTQLFGANSRWMPYKLDDGRQIWQENDTFQKAQQDAIKYSKNPNYNPLDVNLVGRMSQKPTDVGMRVDKNIAKKISETAAGVREFLRGDPDDVEKQVDDLVQEQLQLKSKGYGLKVRDYNTKMEQFKKYAVGGQSNQDITSRISKIKRYNLFTYAILTLQKFVIEIDIGKYGYLDQKTLEYEKVKQKVKFLRLKKGLDIYGVDQEAMKSLDDYIPEILIEYKTKYKKHSEDPNVTPFIPDKLLFDNLLGDYHVSLKILQDVNVTTKAYTNNVKSSLEDLIRKYRYNLQNNITDRKSLYGSLNTVMSEMDDLLKQYYIERTVIIKAYIGGEFSDFTDEFDETISQLRDQILETDKYWFQMMKVIELGIYENFLYDNFQTFEWKDSLPIHVTGRQVFMELFAHAEILREQLHPTEDNPPLCIIPHLLGENRPDHRLSMYTYANIHGYRITVETQKILPNIEELISLNLNLEEAFSKDNHWQYLNTARKKKDLRALVDKGKELLFNEGIHKRPNSQYIQRVEMKLEQSIETKTPIPKKEADELIDVLLIVLTISLKPHFVDYIYRNKLEDIFSRINTLKDEIQKEANRLYELLTGDYIELALAYNFDDYQEFIKIDGKNYEKEEVLKMYQVSNLVSQMLNGITDDIKIPYRLLNPTHPKGVELVDESMFDEIWPERREYRKSVKQGRLGYVHPNFDVEQDPYDYDFIRDDPLASDILRFKPRVNKMDAKQKLRTQRFFKKDTATGQEYLPVLKSRDIFAIQEQDVKDKGKKDWMTAQRGLTDGIQKGKLLYDIKDLSRRRIPGGETENIENARKIRQSYDQVTKDYGGMLRKPTILPRRLIDNRKLKSGVFKAEAPLLEDLKEKLKGVSYDAISNFADYFDGDLETELMDSNPELFDIVGANSSELSEERRNEKKRLFIEKIMEGLENKEFEGSDEVRDLYDERLNLFNIAEANKEGERILYEKVQDEDLEGIIDFLNNMYRKVVRPLQGYADMQLAAQAGWRGKDITNRINHLSRFSLYYDEEQLYKESIRIFNKIIDYSNLSKNNEIDLSGYVDYTPKEYKMQLYSNGQPELDPYRDPLIDYSRDVRVSPLDYKTKDMYGLLSGLQQTGMRDGVPLYSDVDFFRPLNPEESTRRSRFQTSPNRLSRNTGENYSDFYSRIAERRGGGGSKKRTHRKRRSINKRRSQRRTPNRKRSSINKRRSQRKK